MTLDWAHINRKFSGRIDIIKDVDTGDIVFLVSIRQVKLKKLILR